MLKKILIGTLLVGLVGVLVFGAVNRTIAKSGYENERAYTSQGASRGGGRGAGGQNSNPDETDSESDQLEGDGWRYSEGSQGFGQDQGGTRQGGGQGQGRGGGQRWNNSGGQGSGQAEVQEWINLSGTVTALDSDLLLVTSQDGQTIEIEGRAWRFIQEQGFSLETGDAILLKGFYDTEGRLEVAQIENQSNGMSLSIRDSSGRPYWAGRGRQGG
jgi:hypothetical protein